MSRVVRSLEGGRLSFWCPGCSEAHIVVYAADRGPRWSWNGDAERPTLQPSVLVRGVEPLRDTVYAEWRFKGKPLPEPKPTICHSFVTGGRIRFLDDCTHHLKGHEVALPAWPSDQ